MTDHPITPPPELVQQWDSEAVAAEMPEQLYIATQAARWGTCGFGRNVHMYMEPLDD